ncbi:rifamycin-inactivating phosphotransferase [Euzebya sp.]|uniref:rifamycin-inactivating phosphotransferase n=1 Tax=Euzebya sp. TaxID=1971409 RepID=UPI003512584B
MGACDAVAVIDLPAVGPAHEALVGHKAAALGALTRIPGVRVPAGFCVTTEAFDRVVGDVVAARVDALAGLAADDVAGIRSASTTLRDAVSATPIPDDVAGAITAAVVSLGPDRAYAVRSSATAEDLPTASAAGQQDSYLDVVGADEVLAHVRRCWASLFTDRAVAYRLRAGIDQTAVRMGVVVQHMVQPRAAGVLFTADPVTGNRTVATVEAVAGLGDGLVSGRVTPDTSTVTTDDDARARVTTATAPDGPGTPLLTEAEVVALAHLGRRIAAHLGHPQDVEWCLDDDGFHVVQSRPITTLFPVPDAGDDEPHVYVSVGHQQMMTDPMRPLGIAVWQLTSPAPMRHAGCRLFVDVTAGLASPATRDALVEGLGRSDPLIGDALRTVVERGDLLPPPRDAASAPAPPGSSPTDPISTDPAIVPDLVARAAAATAASARAFEPLEGPALVDALVADIADLRRTLGAPTSRQVLMAGIEAAWWLDAHLEEWLGERHAADVLTQALPHDITAEMGLALLDVADVLRPHPRVIACLEQAGDDVLEQLGDVPDGHAARDAIVGFLDTYGVRCVGEIDISRPRWADRPGQIVPLLLAHVRTAEPGAAARRVEEGRRRAAAAETDLLARLRELPDGRRKAAETARAIEQLRAFGGYREHPKFAMVSRYAVYRRALVAEAARLATAGVLADPEDIWFLTVDELRDAVATHRVDDALIHRRRAEFDAAHALTPPRVLTSDGEVITGRYRRDGVPVRALTGLGVSAGVVEGRARVVVDLADADLGPGDILVTAFTDPSWTPTFFTVSGLVTEVGGLMTHGAVVAREFGLPAVVGVEQATRLIADGQRIRVHGVDGYVELLD